jgi:hypothetical protein
MLRGLARTIAAAMATEEARVGIRAVANSAAGFQAILRHRYSDFKVNEISLDMQVADLRVTDAQRPADSPSPRPARPTEAPLTLESARRHVQEFEAQFGQEMAGTLDAYLHQLIVQVGSAGCDPCSPGNSRPAASAH